MGNLRVSVPNAVLPRHRKRCASPTVEFTRVLRRMRQDSYEHDPSKAGKADPSSESAKMVRAGGLEEFVSV